MGEERRRRIAERNMEERGRRERSEAQLAQRPQPKTHAFVFDSKYTKWHKQPDIFEISCGKDLRRSHFDSCFVPTVKRIFVFGGSRYFRGEYFHDIITLDLPGSGGNRTPTASTVTSSSAFQGNSKSTDPLQDADPNESSSVFPGNRWYQLRGQLGRIRGMVAIGEITQTQYQVMLREVEQD